MRPSSSLWLADTRVDVVALLSFAFGFESVIYMNDDDDDPLQAVRKYLSWPCSALFISRCRRRGEILISGESERERVGVGERENERTPTSTQSGLLPSHSSPTLLSFFVFGMCNFKLNS